jgi:hypothetical protein
MGSKASLDMAVERKIQSQFSSFPTHNLATALGIKEDRVLTLEMMDDYRWYRGNQLNRACLLYERGRSNVLPILYVWELVMFRLFLNVYNACALLQLLCFWTLSVILFLFKTLSCLLSETQSFSVCIHSVFRCNPSQIMRESVSSQEKWTSSVDWAQLSRSYLKTGTESSL